MVFWLPAQCSCTNWYFVGRRGSFSSDVLSVINLKPSLFGRAAVCSVGPEHVKLWSHLLILLFLYAGLVQALWKGTSPTSALTLLPLMFVQAVHQLFTKKGVCFYLHGWSHTLSWGGVSSTGTLLLGWLMKRELRILWRSLNCCKDALLHCRRNSLDS